MHSINSTQRVHYEFAKSTSLRTIRSFHSRQRSYITCRAQQDTEVLDQGKASKEELSAASKSGEEIYIGFDKSDTSPRAGRKGRVLQDDPSRYPEKTELTGGWAGGETGLKNFIEEQKQQGENIQKATVIETEKSKDGKSKKVAVTDDGEEIYLGFSKSELEARKTGQKGRSIRDDPRRYPDKEDLGVFSGITGGFAGGEKGVKQFVESGDIKLREDGEGREFSPLLVAALVAGGVTTGAILLNSGVLLSEEIVTDSLRATSSAAGGGGGGGQFFLDNNTRQQLNVGLGVLGVGAVVVGARAIAWRLQQRSLRLKDDVVNIGKIGLFWIAVLLAALYVIDSQ